MGKTKTFVDYNFNYYKTLGTRRTKGFMTVKTESEGIGEFKK